MIEFKKTGNRSSRELKASYNNFLDKISKIKKPKFGDQLLRVMVEYRAFALDDEQVWFAYNRGEVTRCDTKERAYSISTLVEPMYQASELSAIEIFNNALLKATKASLARAYMRIYDFQIPLATLNLIIESLDDEIPIDNNFENNLKILFNLAQKLS